MEPSKLPTFLCIGAPKCGSSWLHQLLESHPHVFIPTELKEVHFFDRKFDKGFDWYARFFQPMTAPQKISGEITPHYLYCDPQRIRSIESINKLIIIYRDPIERCISHYKFRMRLDNYRGTFREFLAEYPEAIEWSMYGKYFEAYLSCFDRSQFLVIRFEDAVNSVPETCARLGQFLGIDASLFPPNVGQRVVNKSFMPKNRTLYKLSVGVGHGLANLGLYRVRNWLKRSFLVRRFFLRENGNFDVQIKDEDLEPLRQIFATDMERFQRLIERDSLGTGTT